jgi:hypothetical protein
LAERIISPRPRLLPQEVEVDPAASDFVAAESEEQLASLAALAGLPLTDRAVTAYIQSFGSSNTSQTQGLR